MKRIMTAVGAAIMLIGLAAFANDSAMFAFYRTDSITCTGNTTAFTTAFTNTTQLREVLRSVFVTSYQATNNWTMFLVNNGITNTLVSPTGLNGSNSLYTIKYTTAGDIPLGAGGVLIVTGQVFTNSAATVSWSVNVQ